MPLSETCSTCGHPRFYHEKGIFDCVVGGFNDDAGGHNFTGTQRALWSSFIDFEIPVPLLYIPVEGDVLDSGGFTSSGVWTSGTETYEDGLFGDNDTNGAIRFDGSSLVTVGNQAKYAFEHIDKFTIAFWMNWDSTHANNLSFLVTKSHTGTGYRIITNTNNILAIIEQSDGAQAAIATSNIAQDTVIHVVLSYSGNSNESGMKIYLDGILDVTGADDPLTASIVASTAVTLGSTATGGLEYEGALDDVAIWDTELSAAQVAFLYNSGTGRRLGFNLRSGLVLKADLNGSLADDTGDNTLTMQDGTEQYVVDTKDINKQVFDFDGSSTIASDNEGTFDFDMDDEYTLACWEFHPTGLTAALIDKRVGTGTASVGYSLDKSASDRIVHSHSNGTVEAFKQTSADVIPFGQWNHVAVTFSGNQDQNGFRVYFNGTPASAPAAKATVTPAVNDLLLTIGGQSDDGLQFLGQMQQVCAWNRRLSAAEISFLGGGSKSVDF